jgi:tetratricopeptide (TPR) repeat protein
VATAQVNVWLAAHRGALDEILHAADESLGDAALARMMLHRRRAIAATVVGEFLDRVGSRGVPYLEGGSPQALRDVAGEMAIAKAAGDVAANVCASAPPLFFERALLEEAEGRYSEALSDLDKLLDAYPGFLAAAIASARLSLAVEDHGGAIRSLAYLESELVQTREGAALLADALRAIGMHEAASRYDLAALMCQGHADSRGNDCAPVDMMGNPAIDARMPPPLILGVTADGRLLCNDRGIYYARRWGAGGFPMRNGSWPLSAPQRAAAWSRSLLHATSKLRLVLARRRLFSRGGVVARGKARSDAAADDALKVRGSVYRAYGRLPGSVRYGLTTIAIFMAAPGLLAWRIAAHRNVRGPMYRSYKRLPEPVRYGLNKYMLLPLRRWTGGGWQEIRAHDRRSEIAQARLRSGIAQIFQSPARLLATGLEWVEAVDTDQERNAAALSSLSPDGRGATSPIAAELKQLLELGDLPPAAAEVLNRLARETSLS